MTFPNKSVAVGQYLNTPPALATNWNITTGNAASCWVGGTFTVICGMGNAGGRRLVVKLRSGPLLAKLLANSSQCIRYSVTGNIPATRKLALCCEQGTAFVVLDACAPDWVNRTRMECPAAQGPALNKAT